MEQAQLEGEVRRLRGELQRRETALHRVEAQNASQSRELSVALQELSQLRGRPEEQRREVEVESSESEADPPKDGSSNEVVGYSTCTPPSHCLLWYSMHRLVKYIYTCMNSRHCQLFCPPTFIHVY